jgi:hypothetical protein
MPDRVLRRSWWRPNVPLLASTTLRGALSTPFFIAGALKSLYDVGLYVLFQDVNVERGPAGRGLVSVRLDHGDPERL